MIIRLTDWATMEPQNPGTPGTAMLAVRLSGETATTHRRVFVAVEESSDDGRCFVLIATEYGDAEAEVLTPFNLDIRLTREGVHEYVLVGDTRTEVVPVVTASPSRSPH